MIRRLLILILAAGLGFAAIGGVILTWGYYYVTRDLPQLSRIEDYQPPAVTRVYSSDGRLISEFFTERRYPAKLKEVPDLVRKCFLAAEDASFYSHKGIDPTSILRAIYKNFQSGNTTQGGSTITQQVVKNLLLSPERTIVRKVKEAILAYKLENRFTKDEILEIYLNQIFFGNTAYGIKAASRVYFHKELSELTLGEGAILAGLPKAPSRYSPLQSMARAKRRQRYVLQQMVDAGFITTAQMDEAAKEDIVVYPASQQNIFASPYFASEIRRLFAEKMHGFDLDTDGLEITVTVDTKADELARNELRDGLREVDKRRGWRGPREHLASEANYRQKYGALVPAELELNTPYPAYVKANTGRGSVNILLGEKSFDVNLDEASWAKKLLQHDDSYTFGKPQDFVRVGDVIEVRADKVEGSEADLKISLDQTPEIEGALALIDPSSGEVRAMVGGYEYGTSQFNRVTQSLRQPGSAFKPIVYLSAIDKFHYTPATIVHDEPRTFRVGDTLWTPGNFDEKYMGPITLRTALEKSRNLVSADIVSRIGVDAPIAYARTLGITSPLGRNLSLSLGSSEVTLLEMTRAYGVFAAGGVLFDTVLIDKALGRPVAGKTGTSNDQMDAWFIGYTPSWVCGVWVGFDQKRQIGPKETGGVVSAPIWLEFMKGFLAYSEGREKEQLEREAKENAERLGIAYVPPEYSPILDFPVPDGVDPFWVDKGSGLLAEAGAPGAILEYFKKGTEPQHTYGEQENVEDEAHSYLESPDL